MIPPPPTSTLFPYTTLFRSNTSEQTQTKQTKTENINSEKQQLAQNKDIIDETETTDMASNIDEVEFSVEIIRSEEHTSELQSRPHLVCRLLLEKKKK